jgi:hypothetical protein
MMSKKRVSRGYWQIKDNVLASASEYASVSEWAKYVSAVIKSARKNGWYDQATMHMYKTSKLGNYIRTASHYHPTLPSNDIYDDH